MTDADWLADLTPADLPACPFRLAAHVMVTDGPKFLVKLQTDMADPANARHRWSAVEADVARLRALVSPAG